MRAILCNFPKIISRLEHRVDYARELFICIFCFCSLAECAAFSELEQYMWDHHWNRKLCWMFGAYVQLFSNQVDCECNSAICMDRLFVWRIWQCINHGITLCQFGVLMYFSVFSLLFASKLLFLKELFYYCWGKWKD